MPQEPADATNTPTRSKWQLFVSPIVLLLAVFSVSYGTGAQSVEPIQQEPFTSWFWLAMAVFWTIRAYKRGGDSRLRLWAIAIGLPALGLIAFTSFRAGQNDRYPVEARRLVAELQARAREAKRIKAELADRRSRVTTPWELLTVEPTVSELNTNIEAISGLTKQLEHYTLPATIAQLMVLLRQALPIEQRQVENLQHQIAVVRSTQDLSPLARDSVYREQLLPLIQQEQGIEREREAAGLQDKMQQLAKPR
jgi:hypothetical protein